MNEINNQIRHLQQLSINIEEEIDFLNHMVSNKKEEIRELREKINFQKKELKSATNSKNKIYTELTNNLSLKEKIDTNNELIELNNEFISQFKRTLDFYSEKIKKSETILNNLSTELAKQEEEDTKKLILQTESLCKTYNIVKNSQDLYDLLSDYYERDLVNYARYKRGDAFSNNNNLEKTKLLELIRSCKYNEITIRSSVNKSIRNELKNQLKEVKITSREIFEMLEDWLVANIDKVPDDFNISDIKTFFFNKRFHQFSIDNDTLIKTIHFEARKQDLMNKMSINRAIGLICKSLFQDCINNDLIKENDSITIQYSFIYDCIVLFGLTSELDINKEKYTKVKDWIKTYETFLEGVK